MGVRQTTEITHVKALLSLLFVSFGVAPMTLQRAALQAQCAPGQLAADSASLGVSPPKPDSLFIPPLPIPASVRGSQAIVRLVVDSTGRALRDSVAVCGIKDRGYARRLASQAAKVTFRPAVFEGRPAQGIAHLYYPF